MRNCRGYIFRLQKQSERNFLAFAPECGPMCRADEALRRGLLLEETRREVATTSQSTQANTQFCYRSQPDHLCRPGPCQYVVRIHNKAQRGEQVLIHIHCMGVRTCVQTLLNALYCTVRTQSHAGHDWALVMLCKLCVGEDLLSITEGQRPAKGGREVSKKGRGWGLLT